MDSLCKEQAQMKFVMNYPHKELNGQEIKQKDKTYS